VTEGDRHIRARRAWEFSLEFMLGESLDGKTFGVVGAGKIGRETARLAESFGARPLLAGRNDSLDELLAAADIVSLHVPLVREGGSPTYHLINERTLKLMRKDAYLINASRGPVVDENALAKALKERWIAGAALDVYENEPFIHPGLKRPNVVLAPHMASATLETRTRMAVIAAENVVAFFAGERPPNILNPDVLKPR